MPLLYSAPLASDFRRSGASLSSDTDANAVQYDLEGNSLVAVTASGSPTGFPGSQDFGMAPDGSPACLFTANPTVPGASLGTRSELSFPLISIPSAPTVIQLGYRCKFWFGSEWMSSGMHSVAQLHRGAALPDRWLFMLLFAGSGVLQLTTPKDFTSDAFEVRATSPITPDSWMDVLVLTRMVKNETGQVELFVNGRRVGLTREIRTSYDDTSTGPYPKVGVYNILKLAETARLWCKDFFLYTGSDNDAVLGVSRRIAVPALPGR